jgi:(p)ppGpp synthase/HD superfamily hydrolase
VAAVLTARYGVAEDTDEEERMNLSLVDVMRAADFAARRHAAQRRKGAAQEPYVNHLLEVARLLAEATGGDDPVLLVAGLLHDTVEDVGVTPEELEREFGPEVRAVVAEVTDDKSLPKEARKRLQIENAPHKSRRAKMLKIADKISNLRGVLESPPPDWSMERRIAYFHWARDVVAGCRGVNAALERLFDETFQAGTQHLADSVGPGKSND